MVWRPNEYHNKDGIGMPADDIALNTTDPNTMVALLKGVFGKLGGGTTTALATEKAQGSTTAGQLGVFVQAAVTTAAPAYGNGTTDPLSLKTNGDLRVADADLATLLTAANLKLDAINTNTDTLEALATLLNTYVDSLETLNGAVTETAPVTDTGSSGLNGRLQRLAQKLDKLDRLEDIAFLLTDKALADADAFDRLHLDLIQARLAPTDTLRLPSAAGSTNATVGVVGPCRVFNIQGQNAASTTRYLKLYDLSRAPVVGTDTPKKTLALPPGAAFAFDWSNPYSFRNGLAYALTTGAADSDTAALTAADVVGLNVDYA
jgi:hypothetical protein